MIADESTVTTPPEVLGARHYACLAHGTQKYGRDPYSWHLLGVVSTLSKFHYNEPHLLMAGWLHDVLEDTGVTAVALLQRFPSNVVALVQAVTNEPGANRKERHLRTYPKIRAYGKDAVVLKMADRISNTQCSRAGKTAHLAMYQREFPDFFEALYRSGECDAMWEHLRKITLNWEELPHA